MYCELLTNYLGQQIGLYDRTGPRCKWVMACRQNMPEFCRRSTSLNASLRESILRESISHETAAATAAVVATIGSTMMQPVTLQCSCVAKSISSVRL